MSTFTDLYVVRWLLQNTDRGNIVWRKSTHGVYFVNFGEEKTGIHIEIEHVQSRPMAQIALRFSSSDSGEIQVVEPLQNILPFTKKYDSDDERELAETMKHLLVVVADQLAKQQLKDMETENVRKQKIFSRLMSGC